MYSTETTVQRCYLNNCKMDSTRKNNPSYVKRNSPTDSPFSEVNRHNGRYQFLKWHYLNNERGFLHIVNTESQFT